MEDDMATLLNGLLMLFVLLLILAVVEKQSPIPNILEANGLNGLAVKDGAVVEVAARAEEVLVVLFARGRKMLESVTSAAAPVPLLLLWAVLCVVVETAEVTKCVTVTGGSRSIRGTGVDWLLSFTLSSAGMRDDDLLDSPNDKVSLSPPWQTKQK